MSAKPNKTARQQLQKLQFLFHEQLPGKLHEIEQAFQVYYAAPTDHEALNHFYCLIHNLAGTAGTFGARQVAAEAMQMNRLLKPLLEQQTPISQQILDILAERVTTTQQLASHWDPHNQNSLFCSEPTPKAERGNNLIYIVEDDELQARQLIAELEGDGYELQHFHDTESFQRAYRDRIPGIILMDMVFEAGEYSGAEVLQSIKQTHTTMPPIIFISIRNDMEARLAAMRAGATRYCSKPLDLKKLHSCINGLTTHHDSDPFRVLIIDDDDTLGNYFCEVMQIAGIHTQYCSEPMQALKMLAEFQPELVLLDIFMPQVTGLEVASVIRQDDSFAHIPIVFLSTETNIEKQTDALHLGGDDFLSKPIEPEYLIATVTARLKRSRWVNRLNTNFKFALQEIEYQQIALDQHSIVSVTDTQGNITEVNHKFSEICGYHRGELIGKNHRLLNSGLHPEAFFETLWKTIIKGEVWHGKVCNRARDGSLFWVKSTIVPFLSHENRPYKYISIMTDITHLMETQEALSASEKNFRAIFNNIQDIFYQTDLEGRVTMLSPSAENYCGYKVSEVMGQSMAQFYADPADRDRLLRALQDNGGRVSNYDISMRHKNGQLVEVSTNSHFFCDEHGEVIGIEGTVRDITENKKIQQALQESEARLKRSQNFANIGTWDWNIQSGELFWSERIGPLFGYQQAIPETTYEVFLNAVHPDDRDRLVSATNACISDGREFNLEHRVIWQDGSTHWMLEQGDVVRADDGTPQHMLGVVQDITDRKHAEFALIERERQLREAQALAHLGSWDANLSSGELTWSDEIYRIFGYAPGSFTPSLEAFHAAIHPDDLDRVNESEQKSSQTGHHDVIHRVVRPDGNIRHVHELAHAETDAEGHLLRLVGTVQDITEQVKAEQALIAARDEAEQANHAKSQFLSSMSHELRTPMNAILGFGQLLELDDLNPEQQDHVQEILHAGQHLLELINEVLDLAKIESGHVKLTIEDVSLSETLAESLALLAPMLQKYQVRLDFDEAACHQIHVAADSVRLKQVLINLLSNAIKYNRPGGRIKLSCEPDQEEGMTRVAITDTGIGISAEALQQLFIPFTRIEANNNTIEGTGIGLVITKNLLQLMHGDIGVESEPGVGSTFWFTLPLTGATTTSRQSMPDIEAGRVPSAPTSRSQRDTILYIEDNPTNLRLVKQVLSRWPHIHLISAHEPHLGLELTRLNRPDLILLDINMPGLDGYDLLKQLKSEAEIRTIPVIAVSANATSGDIERGRQAGFSDYITKPIQVTQFLTSIADILDLPSEEIKTH